MIITSIQTPRPLGNSPAGLQRRLEFAHNLLTIAVDHRLLWLPLATETTGSTTLDRNARAITYDASIASRFTAQGSGYAITFDGTDDEGDTPDTANLSFGDGTTDQPFSVYGWVNVTNTAAIRVILSKFDLTTGSELREWEFDSDSDDTLRFMLFDESADLQLLRASASAITQGSFRFFAATYDGSREGTGIKLYEDAAALSLAADGSDGSYVAMENLSTLVRLGFRQGTAAGASFFSGSMLCVGLVAKELTVDELWAMKALGNSFFDLSL